MIKLKLTLTLVLFSFFILATSCSKKEESPEPVAKETPDNNNGGGNPPPPPPPVPDTLDMLTQSGWVIDKVLLDNVEDASSPALGHIYTLSSTNNYTLTVPGVGSSGGTWAFASGGKSTLDFTPGMGGGTPFQWVIVSLSSTNLVVDRLPVGTSQVRIEFTK